MYIIKIGDKYAKFEKGMIYKVESPENATQFKTESITKHTIEDLTNRSHYKNVSYEQMQ